MILLIEYGQVNKTAIIDDYYKKIYVKELNFNQDYDYLVYLNSFYNIDEISIKEAILYLENNGFDYLYIYNKNYNSKSEIGYRGIYGSKIVKYSAVEEFINKNKKNYINKVYNISTYLYENTKLKIGVYIEPKYFVVSQYKYLIESEINNIISSKEVLLGATRKLKQSVFEHINLLFKSSNIKKIKYNKIEFMKIAKELFFSIDNAKFKQKYQFYNDVFEFIEEGLYDEGMALLDNINCKEDILYNISVFKSKTKYTPIQMKESLSWKITILIRVCEKLYDYINKIIFRSFIIICASYVKVFTKGKEIWLIGERRDQAEDNGFKFFEYCRKNYKKENIYYVIDKKSPHINRVEEYGNVIYHSSIKHYIYMIAANKYISGWTFKECSYPQGKYNFQSLFRNNIKKKCNVCLQHGVVYRNISPYLNKKSYNQHLIFCSSEKELEVFEKYLDYERDEIKVTGLARFDSLHDFNTKKTILIMPTWRRSLFNISVEDFKKSTYFKKYNALLNNKELLEYFNKNNIDVKFYIHSQLQKYMKCFEIDSKIIKFCTKENSIVANLLKESRLLITDYSSVSMDFLYMNKQVLYYQFDEEEFHHPAIDDIKCEDVGIVVKDEILLKDKIINIINREFKIEDKYSKYRNVLFKYIDTNNCERIYKEISNWHNGKSK